MHVPNFWVEKSRCSEKRLWWRDFNLAPTYKWDFRSVY